MDALCADAQIDIGNIWMWLAGITYHDWQQYHGLKDMTSTIKQRIHVAGAGSHFDTMAELQENAEGAINTVAKGAAARLAELKEIGREKILLGDATENFGAGWVRASTNLAAKDIESEVNEAAGESEKSTGVVDQISVEAEKEDETIVRAADTSVTKISEVIHETPPAVVEPIASRVSKEVDPEKNTPVESKPPSSEQDILSSTDEAAANTLPKLLTATLETPQGVDGSIALEISNGILGKQPDVMESIAPEVSTAVSKVLEEVNSATSPPTDIGLSSASSTASKATLAADEGIINAKDRAQKVFKVPESGIDEKLVTKTNEVPHETERRVAENATDAAVNLGEKAAGEAVHGKEPDAVQETIGAAARVEEKVASRVSEVAYSTELTAKENSMDTDTNDDEKVVSNASEVIFGADPEVMEESSSVTPSIASETSGAFAGAGPGTQEKGRSAVERVAKVSEEIVEMGDDTTNTGSSLASIATGASDGPTSNVEE